MQKVIVNYFKYREKINIIYFLKFIIFYKKDQSDNG